MRQTYETLLRAMNANGYEYSWMIPTEEIVFVQKVLNLKGKTDDELFDLWNEVSDIKSNIYNEYEEETVDMEIFKFVREYGITILNIINQSKSFKSGILY